MSDMRNRNEDMNLEESLEWIRQYADNSRILAQQVIGWEIDRFRLMVGLVELVEWDEPEKPLSRRTRHLLKPEARDTRVIHHNGYAYLVRDKAL